MEKLEKQIKISGIKAGLILGLVTTLLAISSFYYIVAVAKSPLLFIAGPIIFRIFIPVFVVIFICVKVRKHIGGYWTFKQATTGIFIMFFTAYLVNLVGKDLIFDKIIAPNNIEIIQNAAVSAKAANMKQRGADQNKINASTAQMRHDLDEKKNNTIWGIVMDNAMVILFLFVFALIFASLLRNAEYVSVAKDKNQQKSFGTNPKKTHRH